MADTIPTTKAKTPRKTAARKAAPKPGTKKAAASSAGTLRVRVSKAAASAGATASAARARIAETVESVDWKAQADQLKTQAGEAARAAAVTAKDSTGSAMANLARLIADTANTVDSKLGPQYGNYARTAAEAVAGAGKSLDDTDIDQLFDEARDFVRKSPALAIGAAAITGYVLMRLARGGGGSDGNDES